MRIPRLLISGLSGGAGKTMLSLGFARAFARKGLSLRAFKKGPDYIDAAWLAAAARAPQATLDPFFTPGAQLASLFISEAAGCDLALIEGNRGLFDGLDINGSCSTAEVSRLLAAPVVLVLDCTKMTRTVAAVVRGCLDFEEGVIIGGVILNRTGNERHRALVRRAVEELTGVPVLGTLPRREEPFIAERHMGLAGLDEYQNDARLDDLAAFVSDHADLDRVLALARTAPELADARTAPNAPYPDASRPITSYPDASRSDAPHEARELPRPDHEPAASSPHAPESPSRSFGAAPGPKPAETQHAVRPRIGYALDAAFWFYYRENLTALETAGARLTPVSLLAPGNWPELDGLYIGGGLPELHAAALSANGQVRDRVLRLAGEGLPMYAECGGFMYLARNLVSQGVPYPMAGVFPLDVERCKRPQGLGYVEAEVAVDSPYHPKGRRFRGHEFHFSRAVNASFPIAEQCLLRLRRGMGMARDASGSRVDGLITGNCFAAYTHLYAPAVPHWAPAFVSLCKGRPL